MSLNSTLTDQQWAVMRALRKGWQSTDQIAKAVHTTNAGIIKTGHSLRGRGLVVSVRRQLGDRNNVLGWLLTIEGTELLTNATQGDPER